MTDIAKDLLKEQKEQKNIANQVFHKKGMKGGKGCTLPSDNLSKKELEAKNGPTYVYQTQKPMSYTEFKAMPKHLQEMYIHHLQTRYGVPINRIEKDLFFVSNSVLRSYCQKYDIRFKTFGKGYRMSKEDENRWRIFLAGHDTRSAEEKAPIVESVPPVQPTFEIPTIVENKEELAQKPRTRMASLTMNYTGVIDPDDIANSLRHLFGTDSVGDIRIEVTLKEDSK